MLLSSYLTFVFDPIILFVDCSNCNHTHTQYISLMIINCFITLFLNNSIVWNSLNLKFTAECVIEKMWSWKMLACRWNLIFFSLISCTRIYDSSHVILQSSCISFRQYVLTRFTLFFGCSKYIYWHVCVNHKILLHLKIFLGFMQILLTIKHLLIK